MIHVTAPARLAGAVMRHAISWPIHTSTNR
jgi:hypothetical protein